MPSLETLMRAAEEEDEGVRLVLWRIRHHWQERVDQGKPISRESRVGILRTMLGTIETMRSPSPNSQAYLHHIIGFLKNKLGVQVQAVSEEEYRALEAGESLKSEGDEDELLQIGYDWIDEEDQDARAEFFEFADELMKAGEAERVINVCQLLIGEMADASSHAFSDLSSISMEARRRLTLTMN